jgi:hypothetical protein
MRRNSSKSMDPLESTSTSLIYIRGRGGQWREKRPGEVIRQGRLDEVDWDFLGRAAEGRDDGEIPCLGVRIRMGFDRAIS